MTENDNPSELLLGAISPATLADVLHEAGFRAEVSALGDGSSEVQSASQGIRFFIRFGNASAGGDYFDFNFHCAVSLEIEVHSKDIESWNRSRRFGRAYQLDQHLILSMDASVDGGVTRTHVRSQCLLWDRLMQEFILHLNQLRASVVAI